MSEETEQTATKLKSLPAEYEFTNPSGERDEFNNSLEVREKFDYNPKKYDYPDAEEEGKKGKGYSFYHHDSLEKANDEAFANHTFVGLNSEVDVSSISVNREVDIADLVLFTTLKAPNGRYLKNMNGNLFAITAPNAILTDKNMFKIYRSRESGVGHSMDEEHDGPRSYVISQGAKFATVKMFMNRFNIEMKDMIKGDPRGIQHYRIYQIPGTNRISIYSMMTSPWQANLFAPGSDEAVTSGLAYDTITDVHRFWSLYDGNSSDRTEGFKEPTDNETIPVGDDRYPKYIYESSAPWPNMVKINGNIFNSKYAPDTMTSPVYNVNIYRNTDHTDPNYNKNGVDTLERIGNNYLFEAGYLADGRDRYIMLGFDGKIRWIKYFNEFYDKFFNSDVTPDKIIEDVTPSIVYECPYKDVMTKDGFKLNFVELKNVMTPGYAYSAFDKK